jgi:beta-mannosidase
MTTKTIPLDGEWALRWCDEGEGEAAGWPAAGVAGGDSIVAHVPGMTHLDLMAAGRIEDPLFGRNAQDCAWMEEKDWWYSRTFHLSDDEIGDRVEIVFDGLDTLADIWINGQHVGSSRNALVPWRADITSQVQTGENLVVVRVDTGLRWARRQDLSRYGARASSADADQARIVLRRSAFSTGWDWSPNIATCGIWRPVRVESYRGLALRDVCLRSQLTRGGAARLTALVEIESFEQAPFDVHLTFRLGEAAFPLRATVVPGYNLVTHTFAIREPRLWWPNGMGEPHLYDFRCDLRRQGWDEVVASLSFGFGIREIELRQEPLPADEGQSFVIAVNGEPVFCKGADWVPADSLLSRVTREQYETLLREARDANFNMLRIWGGGTYEADAFWDACDRLGIMVFLDFQFACQQTPEDRPDYLAEVTREAELAVRRLRNRASLVLWSGNNENQSIYASHGRPFFGWRTYHEVLAKAAAQCDPTRAYWPSSPAGGPQFNDWDIGDRHAWQVSLMGEAPGGLADYAEMARDRGKFISEYGFLSPPLRESLEQALPPDQLRPGKPAWEFHANQFETGIPRGKHRNVFDHALDLYFGRKADQVDLDTFILLSQAWQAEAYRFSLAHFRRRKFLTAGTLFWMYNDCWLATSSWSIIDYYLRRKPSWYAVKRVFANEMVSFAQENGRLAIWLVNDRLDPVEGVLEHGFGRFSQDRCETLDRAAHRVAANCSQRLLEIPLPQLADVERADSYYWARWVRDGETLSRHYHWLAPPKAVTLPEPGLRWHVRNSGGAREVEMTATRYAWMVRLDPAAHVRPADNYFDLLPGESRVIRVEGPPEALARIAVSASNHLLGG